MKVIICALWKWEDTLMAFFLFAYVSVVFVQVKKKNANNVPSIRSYGLIIVFMVRIPTTSSVKQGTVLCPKVPGMMFNRVLVRAFRCFLVGLIIKNHTVIYYVYLSVNLRWEMTGHFSVKSFVSFISINT